MSVRIDAMTESDVGDVAAIFAASFPHGAGNGGPDRFREELARAWTRATCARSEDGRIVGFLLAWLVVDELHVLDVAVALDARRKGIARALVLAAIEDAKRGGAVRVLLEVRASNASAIALYRATGFTEHNIRKRYYPDDEDAVEMMCTL